MKYGRPTPDAENDCSSIVKPLKSPIKANIEKAVDQENNDIDDNDIDEMVIDDNENSSSCSKGTQYCDSDLEDEIIHLKTELKDKSVNESEDESHFDNEWITKIKQNKDDKLNTAIFKQNSLLKSWFNYLDNRDEPGKSRFQCRLCNKYGKKANPGTPAQKIPNLATSSGHLRELSKKCK